MGDTSIRQVTGAKDSGRATPVFLPLLGRQPLRYLSRACPKGAYADTVFIHEGSMAKQRGSAADPLWYKDALIYELHVRAFKDSNADGIGDFPGLMQKLDYLQDLGVTCLWLLPFFPSPLKDDGYDISDYLGVHPMYGTIEDFQAFLKPRTIAGCKS